MLLLFDIDGTLIRAGGVGRRALARAFESELGLENALERVRLDGNTDPAIIDHALELHDASHRVDATGTEAILVRYLEYLAEELECAGDRYSVLPGARALAHAASRSSRYALGLATGNVERGARMKLAHGGLADYFTFGGFGSDDRERAVLVGRAIERGQILAMSRSGRSFVAHEIFVIGDTEYDVAAARAVGAVSVGVLHGSSRPDALRASSPDLLVESLDDRVLWDAVGLSGVVRPKADTE